MNGIIRLDRLTIFVVESLAGRVAGNSDSLDVGNDPDAIRLCELKDGAALGNFWLLPSWDIFLRDLSRHRSGIAVSADFHTFRLDLHANGTGLLKRVLVTSVQVSDGRPNL